MVASGRPSPGLRTSSSSRADAISLDLPRAELGCRAVALGDHLRARRRGARLPGSGASSSPRRGWRSPPGDRRSGVPMLADADDDGDETTRSASAAAGQAGAAVPADSGGDRRAAGGRADSPASRSISSTLSMEWDSPEDFTRFVKEIAPPVSNLLKPHPAGGPGRNLGGDHRGGRRLRRGRQGPDGKPGPDRRRQRLTSSSHPPAGMGLCSDLLSEGSREGTEHGCSGEQASSRRGVQGLQQR